MDNGWIVIGIGGATCSGKSTVAAELQRLVPESELIHQDHYFHPVGSPHLEYIEEIKHYNWDTLSAIDTDRMVEDVKAKLSEPRKDDCTSEEDLRVLIIEGTLVLNEPRIHDLCSLRYYFTLPYEISKQRRNDKVYEYPDPPMNFDRVVWPQYLKYKAQLIVDPTVIFVDCHDNDVSAVVHLIMSAIAEQRHIRT